MDDLNLFRIAINEIQKANPSLTAYRLGEILNVTEQKVRRALKYIKSHKVEEIITKNMINEENREDVGEISALKKEVNHLNNIINTTQCQEGELKLLFEQLKESIPKTKPIPLIYKPPREKKSVSSKCATIIHYTDWHYGMNQQPLEIENVNEYNPQIAHNRLINDLNPRIINWTELNRHNYIIDELVIPVTGDLISGDIHQELLITNEWPSPVQAVQAGHLLADAINMFVPHFKKIRVEFIVADNHSRLTKKPQSKQEGLNSFNYVVGFFAKEILSQINNVEFNIYPQYIKAFNVFDFQYLLTHGHGIRGWAGFPYYGIERMVGRQAVLRLQQPNSQYFRVILGHFHAPLNHPNYLIGGSLSGTDAYDHKNGRFSHAIQTAWIVHPKHGEFNWTKFKLK